MQQNYLPPDHDDFLTTEQIKLRYQDTSLIIFKEQKNRSNNFLSFGTSRRTIEYSNFGNDPVIIKPKIINTEKDDNLRNRTKQNIKSAKKRWRILKNAHKKFSTIKSGKKKLRVSFSVNIDIILILN
ncbi:uncharacterized protein LOC141532183 [Cotesia typhae]|uniref:uncharacterized protein LOC141532183 n=1 Tax=Cotesia typhae TaxID=2053667 RepID=UPI003D68620E